MFASSNMLQSIKLAIKDARRWEQRETRKRENAKTAKSVPVFWFSRFLVFSFRWPHPSGQVAFFMCLEQEAHAQKSKKEKGEAVVLWVLAEGQSAEVSAPQPRSEKKQFLSSKRKVGVFEINSEAMVRR